MLALLSMSLWAPGASRCRDYPMRWISQQEMCEILGKDTVSVQNWVLVRFADMVEAIKHWNILKHPETVHQIGKSFNLPHLLHHLFGAQNAARENSAWCKQWRAKNVLSCHDQSRLGYHPVGDMSLVMSAECAKENLSTQLYEGRWLEERVKKMRTNSNSILLIWFRCVSHV